MDWPLVGRRAELDKLRSSLEQGRPRAIMLAGPAGVGKTRLAREALRIADQADMATIWISATNSVSGLPFGALASILPPTAGHPESLTASWSELLHRLGDALTERAAGRRLALFVDDAQLLDDASAALVHQLLTVGEARAVLTLRTGSPPPPSVVALWKDEIAERVDLPGLDGADVQALLEDALAGQVDPALVAHLAEKCQGNTLYLREVVQGALTDGALRQVDALWQLTGSIEPSTRLVELIETRLGELTQPERQILEVLAYGEPLGPAELSTWDGSGRLDDLERHGLIASQASGRRLEYRLGHPLYGDVLRSRLSPAKARAITGLLADKVESIGLRREQDVLRVATWRLTAGTPRAELMLAAARTARWRFDFDLAEELVGAAVLAGAGFDAELLAAEVAGLRGRSEDAERRYARLSGSAANDNQRGQVATMRLDNLAFALGQLDKGLQVAAEAQAAVTELAQRNEIAAREAGLGLAIQGPRAAAQAVEPLLDKSEGPALVWACLAGSFSFGRLGRVTDAIAAATRGYQAQRGLPTPMDWYPWFHMFLQCEALAAAGRFAEAERLGLDQYQHGLTVNSAEARAFFAWHLSRNMGARGHTDTALRYGNEATTLFRKLGRRPYLQGALEAVALANALQGNSTAATEALAVPDDISPRWLGVDATIARAWLAASLGDLPSGCALLQDAAAAGEQIGDLVGATTALHALARFGRAEEAADTLTELAGHMEGELPAARAAHARSLLAGDPHEIAQVASRFETMGADLLAAEAYADAAVQFRKTGRARAATAAQRHSNRLRHDCGPVRTPALQSADARARLTPAEREAASMAAAGRTDRDIADSLQLSLRTIENRLYHVYRKLGISGRDELVQALSEPN